MTRRFVVAGWAGRCFGPIEEEARRRGATRAMLCTYSWQAKGLYVTEGYSEYARFKYPAGYARIDMLKALSGSRNANLEKDE